MTANLNARLKQLVSDAKACPPQTVKRKKCLRKLVHEIQKSGKLSRPYVGEFKGFYEDIYAEALQKLFFHVCFKIDEYDPSRGEVMQWINFLLKTRFFREASEEYSYKRIYRCQFDDSLVTDNLGESTTSVFNDSNSSSLLFQELRNLLESDPRGIFKSTRLANNPKVNFQVVVLKRLDGYSWVEISKELGISISSLSSFYARNLEKFAPVLREDLLIN